MMDVKYIIDEKNEAEVELDNLTIAELLRAYLAQDEDVSFVAWRREHQIKNPILKIRTKGKTVKKAIADTVSKIEKELDKITDDVKKSK